MISIRELDHLVLRVNDLARMSEFYCTVLGMRIEKEQPKFGLRQLRAGSSMLDLMKVEAQGSRDADSANMDHFCFRLEVFDESEILAHLSACGVAAGSVESRYGAEGQGPSIYITDPEGNIVELKGPPELSFSA